MHPGKGKYITLTPGLQQTVLCLSGDSITALFTPRSFLLLCLEYACIGLILLLGPLPLVSLLALFNLCRPPPSGSPAYPPASCLPSLAAQGNPVLVFTDLEHSVATGVVSLLSSTPVLSLVVVSGPGLHRCRYLSRVRLVALLPRQPPSDSMFISRM